MKMIDGIPLTDADYQLWSFILDNEAQAGFKPTKYDVQKLIKASRQPMSHKRQVELQKFDSVMDRLYWYKYGRIEH